MVKMGHDVTWVDLVEWDGLAPYTYSEELAYDEMLDQHVSGVQERSAENTAWTGSPRALKSGGVPWYAPYKMLFPSKRMALRPLSEAASALSDGLSGV